MRAGSVVLPIFIFATTLSAAILVRSLLMKSRKRLAHDVINISVTRAGLFHVVTDTDCRTQNDSAYGSVFATFKRRFLTNCIKID